MMAKHGDAEVLIAKTKSSAARANLKRAIKNDDTDESVKKAKVEDSDV